MKKSFLTVTTALALVLTANIPAYASNQDDGLGNNRRAPAQPPIVVQKKQPGKPAAAPAKAKQVVAPAKAKQAAAPVKAKQVVAPAKAKQAAAPAKAKQVVAPVKAKQAVAPVKAKQAVAPLKAKVVGAPAKPKAVVAPVKAKAAVAPAKAKQAVAPAKPKAVAPAKAKAAAVKAQQEALRQRQLEEQRARDAEAARVRAEQEVIRQRQIAEQRIRDAEIVRWRVEQEVIRQRHLEEQRARDAEVARQRAEHEAARQRLFQEQLAQAEEAARLKAEQEAIRQADLKAEKDEAQLLGYLRGDLEDLCNRLPYEGEYRKRFKNDIAEHLSIRQIMLDGYMAENKKARREVPGSFLEEIENFTLENARASLRGLLDEVEERDLVRAAEDIKVRYNNRMQEVYGAWSELVAEEKAAEEVSERQAAEKVKADKKAGVPSMGRPLGTGSDWLGLPETDAIIASLLDSESAKAFAEVSKVANTVVQTREILVLNDRITDEDFDWFMEAHKRVRVLDLSLCTKLDPNTVLLKMLNLRHLRTFRANRGLFVDANVRYIRQVCPWIETIELVDPPFIGDINNNNNAGPAAPAMVYANRLDMAMINARILEAVREKLYRNIHEAERRRVLAYLEQAREYSRGDAYAEQAQLQEALRNREESNMQRGDNDINFVQRADRAAPIHNLLQEWRILEEVDYHIIRDAQYQAHNNALNARLRELQEVVRIQAPAQNRAYARQ